MERDQAAAAVGVRGSLQRGQEVPWGWGAGSGGRVRVGEWRAPAWAGLSAGARHPQGQLAAHRMRHTASSTRAAALRGLALERGTAVGAGG
jgi:hypothetical protein